MAEAAQLAERKQQRRSSERWESVGLNDLDTGVRVEVSGPIATVTLARPDTRNSQTPATWRALEKAAASLGPDVRAVLLKGEGPSFSAGLDRAMFTVGVPGEASLADLVGISPGEFDSLIAEYQRGFLCWRELDAVTVAVVKGHAVGAGFQLALAADMMLVADDVQLSMKEPQLGLVPDLGGTHPLVHAVGYSRALEICATGRRIGAAEAVASGIAISVHAVEELDQAADDLLAAILAAPAGAISETKHLLRHADQRDRVEQSAFERRAQYQRIQELGALLAPAK